MWANIRWIFNSSAQLTLFAAQFVSQHMTMACAISIEVMLLLLLYSELVALRFHNVPS